jgi:anthranilate synthase component II
MAKKRLLLVDNYDSFVFNLKHLFESLPDVAITVVRNDEDFIKDLRNHEYDGLIIGPGPGSPDDLRYFGNCARALQEFGPQRLPILGVCLGFQGIAVAFGCTLKRASIPMHGKKSTLQLRESGVILDGIKSSIEVMRYHSLMIDMDCHFSDELKITAEVATAEEALRFSKSSADHPFLTEANGREIMAIEHRHLPIFGVQFHPESFGTPNGKEMAKNFVEQCSIL